MKNKNIWKEITSNMDKHEFLKIQRKLIASYGREESHKCSTSLNFRKKLVDLRPVQFRVFVQRKDTIEYYVNCEFLGRKESWTHIDGIFEQRETYKSNPSHPVFKIVCMTDLCERAKEV